MDKNMWWYGNRNAPVWDDIPIEGTSEVGTKLPNPWGLYNIHGNISEWCLDAWDELTERDNQIDPLFQDSELKISKGGSWLSDGSFCRSAIRFVMRQSFHRYGTGFRIVKIVE